MEIRSVEIIGGEELYKKSHVSLLNFNLNFTVYEDL
jgi:hypothetical protein